MTRDRIEINKNLVPYRFNITLAGEVKGEDKIDTLYGYKITMLLQHRITTAAIVNLTSKSIVGTFRVRSGEHNFTSDGEATTTFKAVGTISTKDAETKSTSSKKTSTKQTSGAANKLMQVCQSLKGTKYGWGANSPGKAMDCSHYVCYCFQHCGVANKVTGEGEETDYALRKRFEQAREGAGSCTETSIRAALMRVPTVESVGIIVNDTAETDSEGRPPFSFECYIYGGDSYEAEIAETIYNKKPIGIKTCGDITVDVIDDGGYTHKISFSHTEDISVYVSATIRTDSTFEGDTGTAEIQSNLKDYIDGLGVGEPVILSSLYGKIHAVDGVDEVTALKLSKDGKTYSAANIAVDSYQVAICKSVEIENADSDIVTDSQTTSGVVNLGD